jgi:hypothetical protein
MLAVTGFNPSTPFISTSPKNSIVGVAKPCEPDTAKLPDNSVFQIKVLFPFCRVEPVTFNPPVM